MIIDYSKSCYDVNLYPLRKYSGQQNDQMIYWPPARSNRGGEGSFDETMTSSPPHLHHLAIMTILIILILMMTMTITWSPSPKSANFPTPCSGSKNVQEPWLIFLEPFKTSCCVEGLFAFMQNHRIWKNAVLHLVIINIAKGASGPRVVSFCGSNFLNCYF